MSEEKEGVLGSIASMACLGVMAIILYHHGSAFTELMEEGSYLSATAHIFTAAFLAVVFAQVIIND